MKTYHVLGLIGLFGLCPAGCGAPSTAEVDHFIESMAVEQCAWQFRCCTDPEIKEMDGRKYADMDGCVPYRTLALVNQLYLNRLAAREGRLRVEGEYAEACLAQLRQQACNPKPGMPAPMMDPMAVDACVKVFRGNTPVGDECIYANECREGARCVDDQAAVGRGVCVPYQQDGEICNTDADCDPRVKELYCAKSDYHCRLRAKLGEPCAWTTDDAGQNPTLPLLIECDRTFGNIYCDPDSSTCRKLPGEGEPCLVNPPPGVTHACDPDPVLRLVCDTSGSPGGTSGICRAPGRAGDDCSSIPCGEGLYCDRNTASEICTVLPTLGEDCYSSNYRCQEPFFCNTLTSYVCDEPASAGESCVERPCSTDLYCDQTEERCKYRLPDGSPCTTSNQCRSLDCDVSAGMTSTTCQPRPVTVQCTGRE